MNALLGALRVSAALRGSAGALRRSAAARRVSAALCGALAAFFLRNEEEMTTPSELQNLVALFPDSFQSDWGSPKATALNPTSPKDVVLEEVINGYFREHPGNSDNINEALEGIGTLLMNYKLFLCTNNFLR